MHDNVVGDAKCEKDSKRGDRDERTVVNLGNVRLFAVDGVVYGRFPQLHNAIFPVVLGATVLFELVNPLLTKWALIHAGEVPSAEESQPGQGTSFGRILCIRLFCCIRCVAVGLCFVM